MKPRRRRWAPLMLAVTLALSVGGCSVFSPMATSEGRQVLTNRIESSLSDAVPGLRARATLRLNGFGRGLGVSLYPAVGEVSANLVRVTLSTIAATMPRGVASVEIAAWGPGWQLLDIHDAAVAAGVRSRNIHDRVSIVITDTTWLMDTYG